LQYERGSDDPAVQMETLHIVACALLEVRLLGIVDEQACTAVPRAYFEEALKSRAGLEYTSALPSEVCTGTVQLVQPDASVWFASRGFERFGAPNFAVKGDANHAPLAHEFFNKLLNYAYLHKASVEAGHTTELGGSFVRFYEPASNEGFLRHGNRTTLVIVVEGSDQSQHMAPPARGSNTMASVSASAVAARATVNGTAQTVAIPAAALPLEFPQTPVTAAHRALSTTEREWVDGHAQHALKTIMGLNGQNSLSGKDNLSLVHDLEKAIGVVQTRGYSLEQKQQLGLQMGLLYGRLIVTQYSLAWARPSEHSFVVHNPQTAIDPVALVRDLIVNGAASAHGLVRLFQSAQTLAGRVVTPITSVSSRGEDVPGFQLGLKS
jgi:hypothetical protein